MKNMLRLALLPPRMRARLTASLDAFTIGASGVCLVHCLLLPLLVAAAPSLSRLVRVPEEFHVLAFALAVPASAFALSGGYRRHGVILPVFVASAGLLLIGIGALGGLQVALETGVSVVGSVLLAIGHLVNWRLRKRSAPLRECRRSAGA